MVKKLRLNLHTQTNITKWLWLNKKNESPNERYTGDSFFRLFVNCSGLKKKLILRKDKFRPFFFDVQGDKNPFFEVFKVSKSKCISLDKFDEIISRF